MTKGQLARVGFAIGNELFQVFGWKISLNHQNKTSLANLPSPTKVDVINNRINNTSSFRLTTTVDEIVLFVVIVFMKMVSKPVQRKGTSVTTATTGTISLICVRSNLIKRHARVAPLLVVIEEAAATAIPDVAEFTTLIKMETMKDRAKTRIFRLIWKPYQAVRLVVVVPKKWMKDRVRKTEQSMQRP